MADKNRKSSGHDELWLFIKTVGILIIRFLLFIHLKENEKWMRNRIRNECGTIFDCRIPWCVQPFLPWAQNTMEIVFFLPTKCHLTTDKRPNNTQCIQSIIQFLERKVRPLFSSGCLFLREVRFARNGWQRFLSTFFSLWRHLFFSSQ